MDAGKKVVDSPVHLADFGESSHDGHMTLPLYHHYVIPKGAALTSAESWQLQAVLESTVVTTSHVMLT